jgi:hypothetical protein
MNNTVNILLLYILMSLPASIGFGIKGKWPTLWVGWCIAISAAITFTIVSVLFIAGLIPIGSKISN